MLPSTNWKYTAVPLDIDGNVKPEDFDKAAKQLLDCAPDKCIIFHIEAPMAVGFSDYRYGGKVRLVTFFNPVSCNIEAQADIYWEVPA